MLACLRSCSFQLHSIDSVTKVLFQGICCRGTVAGCSLAGPQAKE